MVNSQVSLSSNEQRLLDRIRHDYEPQRKRTMTLINILGTICIIAVFSFAYAHDLRKDAQLEDILHTARKEATDLLAKPHVTPQQVADKYERIFLISVDKLHALIRYVRFLSTGLIPFILLFIWRITKVLSQRERLILKLAQKTNG